MSQTLPLSASGLNNREGMRLAERISISVTVLLPYSNSPLLLLLDSSVSHCPVGIC